MKMGKIAKLRTWIDSIPVGVSSGLFPMNSGETVVVEVEIDAGVRGYGYAYHWQPLDAQATATLVEALRPDVVGSEAANLRGTWHRIERTHNNFLGTGGIARFALGAVDMALWDAHCKELGRPLSAIVGALERKIPVYASYGLHLSLGPEEVAAQARRFCEQGFQRMKLRIGSPDLGRDRERVAALRDALGPNRGLMVDALQHYDAATAIKVGRMLESFDACWYEDPVFKDDLDGLRRVGDQVGVPIATGENCYTLLDFRRLLELKVVSHVLVDIQRVGGITGWYQVAALAEGFGMPASPHIFPHLAPQLMLSTSNGYIAEYMPFWDHLFGEIVRDGELIVGQEPGIGLKPVNLPEEQV